jgi:hypothetical protein
MTGAKSIAVALSLAFLSAPAAATSFITDSISNPSDQWAGIDYWGVQVSQFSTVDQALSFTIPDDSKIEIFMIGSPKFKFTDLTLNGVSIADSFTVNGSSTLVATGYAAGGTATLSFMADYTCSDCWGDWFGGYVKVTKAILPTPPIHVGEPGVPGAPVNQVPEPSTWAMMILGLGAVGAVMRRRVTRGIAPVAA